MKQNYIYIATSEDFDKLRAVKIGETPNLTSRLSAYNNQLTSKETLAFYLAIFPCNDIIKSDKDLHKILQIENSNDTITWDGPKGSGKIPTTEEAYILKEGKTVHDVIYLISTIINKEVNWKSSIKYKWDFSVLK